MSHKCFILQFQPCKVLNATHFICLMPDLTTGGTFTGHGKPDYVIAQDQCDWRLRYHELEEDIQLKFTTVFL